MIGDYEKVGWSPSNLQPVNGLNLQKVDEKINEVDKMLLNLIQLKGEKGDTGDTGISVTIPDISGLTEIDEISKFEDSFIIFDASTNSHKKAGAWKVGSGGGGGTAYDQDLNTFDSPKFSNLSISTNINLLDGSNNTTGRLFGHASNGWTYLSSGATNFQTDIRLNSSTNEIIARTGGSTRLTINNSGVSATTFIGSLTGVASGLNINALPEKTDAVSLSNDFLVIWEASTSTLKKISLNNLTKTLSINTLTLNGYSVELV